MTTKVVLWLTAGNYNDSIVLNPPNGMQIIYFTTISDAIEWFNDDNNPKQFHIVIPTVPSSGQPTQIVDKQNPVYLLLEEVLKEKRKHNWWSSKITVTVFGENSEETAKNFGLEVKFFTSNSKNLLKQLMIV